MSGVVQTCSVCTRLRAEEAKLAQFEIDAKAAAAAYHDQPMPPPGYRNATSDDLEKLNLSRDLINEPFGTEFRAVIFVPENRSVSDPPTIVSFRGTQGLTDMEAWATNVDQASGRNTFYYTHAQNVAKRIGLTGNTNVRFVGHSLGGGLASAAAQTLGATATTFNSAGLHPKTVSEPKAASIDALHVRGEILTAAQGLPRLPDAAATRNWPLDPPPAIGSTILGGVVGFTLGGQGGAALGAVAYRSYVLHGMDSVFDALARRRQQHSEELIRNGC